MIKNNKFEYGVISKIFHWLMALLIISVLVMGFLLDSLNKPEFYKIHKAVGFVVLLLAIMRLFWRLINKAPEYQNSMPQLIVLAANLGHYLLYGLMIAVPLSAFIASNAAHRPVSFLFMFDMSSFFETKNIELAKNLMNLHSILAFIFAVVIIIHVLAVGYHHFIRKDNILLRMTPCKKIHKT